MDYQPAGIHHKKTMELLNILMVLPFLLASCNDNKPASTGNIKTIKSFTGNAFKQIKTIPLPAGFERVKADSASFTSYLRNIGLKDQPNVYLYNGKAKLNQTAQYAVLNISTGNTDLQQCADAVMRLRAEYFFEQKQFDQIFFVDNENTNYTFSAPYTRDHFNKYLNRVFGMCGTASLAKQLKPVNSFFDIEPGYVLIRGGFPGHAVIILDVAINDSGRKIYLLAQSYMPAQDIHVLKNPVNEDLSPWYEVNDNYIIQTPEYTFTQNELMRW